LLNNMTLLSRHYEKRLKYHCDPPYKLPYKFCRETI